MDILVVYEDETPYNPIVFAHKVDDIDDIKPTVEKAIKELKIDTDGTTADDIAWELSGLSNHCWVAEHWCFGLRKVGGV